MFAQTEPAPLIGERAAIDHLRPRLGQRPFVHGRKFLIQLAGQNQLQHGVAEKFQALIVLHGGALLMGDRGMGQGEAQQILITEKIA